MTQNGRTEKELTPVQARGVRALLTCTTLREAARQVGISEGTLYDWLADPVFRGALRAAEAAALEDVVRGLTGASQAALETILKIMRNTKSPASARLRAAGMILDNLLKLREQLDVEERLKALEDRVESGQSHYRN